MDFSWSEEQLEYREAVEGFAQKELSSDLQERDRDSEFSLEDWKKCADFGIQGLPFPEEYGGGAADILTAMLTMEGLGYGSRDNGLIFGINAQMWSVQMPILKFGHDEIKKKYLHLIFGVEIGGTPMHYTERLPDPNKKVGAILCLNFHFFMTFLRDPEKSLHFIRKWRTEPTGRISGTLVLIIKN